VVGVRAMEQRLGDEAPDGARLGAPPLIEARGLGVARGGRWLVRGVDLAIRPGEIVTLIGPNGSGKSTTVKALLGILAPATARSSAARTSPSATCRSASPSTGPCR
jgi:zinc transport system ATP-binding protein